jgi:hypothetical protein
MKLCPGLVVAIQKRVSTNSYMPNDASHITADSMNAVTVHVSKCAVVVNKIQGGCVGLCMLTPALLYPLKTTWEKMHVMHRCL